MPHLPSRLVRPRSAALCGASSALLLLFTDTFDCANRSTVESLRAELTALSTALLVVGEDEMYYFNAGPQLDVSGLPSALESRALTGWRQAYGRHRAGGVTVSLLEPDGRERFRLSRKLRTAVPEALLEALQIARQSTDLPASFRTFSERELLFYSLVGALNLVLNDVAAFEPFAQSAQA